MRSVQVMALGVILAAQLACDEEPFKSKAPSEPPPPAQGIQAFLQVDDDQATPGEHVQVYVRVQLGSGTQLKVGSYAGRLRFDPEALEWVRDVEINDGLRVVNPADATAGSVRFAGASAGGLNELVLYQGEFVVRRSRYLEGLRFDLDEISAALSLQDMEPQLELAPQVFLRAEAR